MNISIIDITNSGLMYDESKINDPDYLGKVIEGLARNYRLAQDELKCQKALALPFEAAYTARRHKDIIDAICHAVPGEGTERILSLYDAGDGYNFATSAFEKEGTIGLRGSCGYGSSALIEVGKGSFHLHQETCGGHWVDVSLITEAGETYYLVSVDTDESFSAWGDAEEPYAANQDTLEAARIDRIRKTYRGIWPIRSAAEVAANH